MLVAIHKSLHNRLLKWLYFQNIRVRPHGMVFAVTCLDYKLSGILIRAAAPNLGMCGWLDAYLFT
jgi:hypothetical protein